MEAISPSRINSIENYEGERKNALINPAADNENCKVAGVLNTLVFSLIKYCEYLIV